MDPKDAEYYKRKSQEELELARKEYASASKRVQRSLQLTMKGIATRVTNSTGKITSSFGPLFRKDDEK